MEETLMLKHITGHADAAEKALLRQWFLEKPCHKVMYEKLLKIWTISGRIDWELETKTASEWEKLKQKIGASELIK